MYRRNRADTAQRGGFAQFSNKSSFLFFLYCLSRRISSLAPDRAVFIVSRPSVNGERWFHGSRVKIISVVEPVRVLGKFLMHGNWSLNASSRKICSLLFDVHGVLKQRVHFSAYLGARSKQNVLHASLIDFFRNTVFRDF